MTFDIILRVNTVGGCEFIFAMAAAAISSKQSWLEMTANPLSQHRFAWTKLLPHLLV